ncbi:MAG: cytochrome P450 [Pseudomonadota bacterium]
MSDDILDPLSSGFADNPYATYERLRTLDEPPYFAPHGAYLLSRYDDVVAVATNPMAVRSLAGHESEAEAKERQRRANWHDMPYHERVVQFSLLDSDGDVHRRLRTLVFGDLTNRSIAVLEAEVRRFVVSLLDELSARDEIEFIADFAAHIPGHVIGRLLGCPAEDAPQLRQWSEQVVQFFDVDRSAEKKELAETATRDFYHYLDDLKVERTRAPKDDLILKMLVDERAGHYTPDEFISTCMLLLMAGHGSTIDVLGSGLHTLLKHPDALMALRGDPALIPTAIQEMFRYESPLPFFHRHALEDVTLRGQHFPAGTTFGLLYGAANRDPAQFERADTFDIHREPNRHLAFGMGAHLCLGNHLARMNMRVIFEELFQRTSAIELATDTVIYKPGLSVRGPKSLPVRMTSA